MFPFGLTELSQFQLHSGSSALSYSLQWECVQGAELELSVQDVFHVNIHRGFYQEGLLGIIYNSRCLEEESTSQLGIKKTGAYLVQFNVQLRKGGWPGLSGRQQSASSVCGVLGGGE